MPMGFVLHALGKPALLLQISCNLYSGMSTIHADKLCRQLSDLVVIPSLTVDDVHMSRALSCLCLSFTCSIMSQFDLYVAQCLTTDTMAVKSDDNLFHSAIQSPLSGSTMCNVESFCMLWSLSKYASFSCFPANMSLNIFAGTPSTI